MSKTKDEAYRKIEELEEACQLWKERAEQAEGRITKLNDLKALLDRAIPIFLEIFNFSNDYTLPNNTAKVMHIADQETVLEIDDVLPEIIDASPTDTEGKVLWALCKLGKPSTFAEINSYLIESRRSVNVSRTLDSLKSKGLVIQEGEKKGTKYRFPNNVRVESK